MSKHDIIIAGFGGQGVLFTGKVLVTCGMNEGMQVCMLAFLWPGNARRYGQRERFDRQ